MKTCLITNDVEKISLIKKQENTLGKLLINDILPKKLDIYQKYDVKSTFFIVAEFAQEFPEIIKLIQRYGHEIACHGFTHDHNQAFDCMSLDKQIKHLSKAKNILEDISGEEVVSFRSPALRVNKDTPIALVESGFKYDSSIAPQRMDMFMSLGSKDKMQWFNAPREPYQTSINNLARRGTAGIIEVPVSSYILPYIGTFMRLSPTLNKILRYLLYLETKNTNNNKIINFLIHPTEFVTPIESEIEVERRKNNYILHLLSDVIRPILKRKNLGDKAFPLIINEIEFWKKVDYEFKTIKEVGETVK